MKETISKNQQVIDALDKINILDDSVNAIAFYAGTLSKFDIFPDTPYSQGYRH
ncbi:MAG: hypothetical protein GKR95_16070 [Gammaproteobacteria bacterium]|nr:hypothetical protein [Gammaproteobacteria bacterium]NKB63560.1 hypothetical protein [Gammaproteobacteria bacterium]